MLNFFNLKIINLIRDFFLVYDKFKTSGYRISEAMIINVLVLLSSATVVLFGYDLGISEADNLAIAGGIYAIVNIIVRLRSKGGESKIKRELK